MRQYWGEIKDPVLGYVYITEIEKEIIDSFPVQRLRRLRQLAGTEFVYPGANHTRFEHSIGVMHLAGLLSENPHLVQVLSEDEVKIVRIAALLHDVGHGPFSHVFEHILTRFLRKTHEDMTAWIVQKSELKDIISRCGFNPNTIGALAVGALHRRGKAFMDQIIRSAIDVDKLDFIVRDTYHTGAQYGYVDIHRLIHMTDVLDENLSIDLGALSALESFILARIESFRSIYFHRVGRSVQIMLAVAMEAAKDELGLTEFQSPERYLSLNDYIMWTKLKECEKSRGIMEDLERRRLLKCVYDQTFYMRDKTVSSIFSVDQIRNEIRDQIASAADVESTAVMIDVPTVPSVPYRHSAFMEPMEIPVFRKTGDQKVSQRLSEISGIFDVLRGFINILRVYTDAKHREKVGAAAAKVLGRTPTSAKISY
ncbi:MAG: HD domain-containing protein [Candidatus Bathyarchaeota archaeon]|nr:MAG: HD domain-containing protein [Candidatus Bathyarchaeota archaeon]